MTRARLAATALAASSLCFLSGCLTFFSKTEVLRGDEQPRPIRFENPQAADEFHKARRDRSSHIGGAHVGVPFITLYSKNQRLSENAHFNDCVARCDCDQDGIITFEEAAIFAKVKE